MPPLSPSARAATGIRAQLGASLVPRVAHRALTTPDRMIPLSYLQAP